MTKNQMEKLLKKHYELQTKATELEIKIINEVRKYKPDSELVCGGLACIPYSEPYNLAGIVFDEIGEYLDD